MVIYSMAMFVIYSIKKKHLAWAFLAILILQALKINGITPSLHYVFVLLTLFIPHSIFLFDNMLKLKWWYDEDRLGYR